MSSVLRCCVAYNKYGGFCVPTSSRHRTAARKILSGEVYEPETIEFLTSHSGGGDIVHAGAYFGDFLPALSRSVTSDAKVWTFEPNQENYRCAMITTYINDLQNVELENAALGERRETLTLVTSKKNGVALGGGSRILRRGEVADQERGEMVQAVTLDEVIPPSRRVSIIHLDVEGYEREALSGALGVIQCCLPIILLEGLPENRWMNQNILCLGYRKSSSVHDNTIYVPLHYLRRNAI